MIRCKKCYVGKKEEFFYFIKSTKKYDRRCKSCISKYISKRRKKFSWIRKNDRKRYEKNRKDPGWVKRSLLAGYAWGKKNPDKKKSSKLYWYWPNLTPDERVEEFRRLIKKQLNKCAICKRLETSKHSSGKIRDLSVDHCHATKRVRGLLCNRCNRGIGYFKEDINILKDIIKYLRRTKKGN